MILKILEMIKIQSYLRNISFLAYLIKANNVQSQEAVTS